MIQITNFKYNQYMITYNIDQNTITGIYCVNNMLLEPLLLRIAGINKSTGIYYRSKGVFDDAHYFDERLYLDCNKQGINSLHAPKIAFSLEKRFKTIVDENKLKDLIGDLSVRMEGTLSGTYTFTQEGITLCNNIIALSCFKYPILLNPFENINNLKRLEYLKQQYKKSKPSLIGITDLSKYRNFLNNIIILGHNNVYILNETDRILLLTNIINQDLVISECSLEKLIIYKSIKTDNLIIYNDLSSVQSALLKRLHVDKKEITFYDIGDYIC